jgi:hypothetical protein
MSQQALQSMGSMVDGAEEVEEEKKKKARRAWSVAGFASRKVRYFPSRPTLVLEGIRFSE